MEQATLQFGDATTARSPLVVCYGVGQDSTGMICGMYERGIRPDLILFADVGCERDETYSFIPIMNDWLRSVGFPQVTTVRYVPQKFKHWPPYYTLEENCLTNRTLPSIAYGYSKCSSKWKIAPQHKFLTEWPPAIAAWSIGLKVTKCIGFDASPYERERASGCSTYAFKDEETALFDITFPLQEWGWERKDAIAAIERACLPVPPKSSCYFCTAMKPWEVDTLDADKWRRIVLIEHRALGTSLRKAEEKGWPNGVGRPLTDGLWRKRVKGTRGGIAKPGSMTEYIREKGLLKPEEIDRIQAATPTCALSDGDLGAANWEEWVQNITTPKEGAA